MDDKRTYEDAEIVPSYSLPTVSSRRTGIRVESQPLSATPQPSVRPSTTQEGTMRQFAPQLQPMQNPGFQPMGYPMHPSMRMPVQPQYFIPRQPGAPNPQTFSNYPQSKPNDPNIFSLHPTPNYEHSLQPMTMASSSQPSNYSSQSVGRFQQPNYRQPVANVSQPNFSSQNVGSYSKPNVNPSQQSNYSSQNVSRFQQPISNYCPPVANVSQPGNYSSQNVGGYSIPTVNPAQPSNYSSQNLSFQQPTFANSSHPNNFSSHNLSGFSQQNKNPTTQPAGYPAGFSLAPHLPPNNFMSPGNIAYPPANNSPYAVGNYPMGTGYAPQVNNATNNSQMEVQTLNESFLGMPSHQQISLQSKDAMNPPQTTQADEFPNLINDLVDSLKEDNKVVDELKFILNDNFSDEELNAMNDIRTILDKMIEKNLLSENNLESLEAYLRISHKKLSRKLELFRNSSDGKIDESSLEQSLPPGQFLFQSQRPKGEPYVPEVKEEWGITCYAMDKRPHGICAIFNNENFNSDSLGKRKGSEIDRNRLIELFKYLQYDVRTYNDLGAEQMKKEMGRLSQLDHTKYDSFVCCILTHGADNDVVYGSDGSELRLRSVLAYFYAKQCRTLFGKPKVFFIQACRGEKEDMGSSSQLIEDIPKSYTDMTEHYDSSDLPDTADFLIAFPTSSGYVSWRSHNEGTWYIESLCEILKENHNQHDLLSLLTMVNNSVAERKTDEGLKQMPAPVTHLRKALHIRT